MQDHKHVRRGSARAGALLLAMTMLVGTIATPALGEPEPEPNACQYVEYEYELVSETVETSELQATAPDGDGWESIHSEEVVVQARETATFHEWRHHGNDDTDWVIEGQSKNSPPWHLTGKSEVRVTQEEVTETHHIYERTVTSTTAEWFTSDPGGDWEPTGDTRIVDIPDCDPYELDPSNPAAGQCDPGDGAIKLDTGDDYSGTVMIDGVEVLVTVDGTEVTFSEPVEFCVKASNGNSGLQSGTYYDVDFVNRGGQYPTISNVVIYGLVDVQPDTVTVTLQKNWTGDDEEFFGHLQDGEFVTEILTVEVNGDEHPESPFTLESTGPGVAPFAAFDVGEGDVVEVTDEEVLGLPDADDCTYDPNFPEAITVTEDTTIVVTNDVTCGDDDTVTIALVKEWFDFEGNLVDEPEGIDWGINLYVGTDEEPSASLPGDDNVVTMDLLDDGAPARYGIQEEPAPEGWEAVPCDTVRFGDLTWVNEGTSELLVEGGADSGAFGASESGTHLVCNQEVPDDGTIPVGLYKLWLDADGEVIQENTPDVDFTLTLSVDDDILATLDQDDDPPSVWVDLEPGATYTVAETNLAAGWRTVTCPEFDGEAGAGEYSGTGTFELTDGGRHFVCNQQIPARQPRPITTPTPTTVDLTLYKVWLDVDGSALTDPPMVDFELTLTVDGEVIATVDEDTARAGETSELELGTTYVVAESIVPDGWEVATCPATLHGPDSGVVAHGIGSFDAEVTGDHIVCNQPTVEVAPIVIERPEPTPVDTPEPVTEPDPVPVAAPEPKPEVEVLGVTEELPRTGIGSTSMLLAAAILMLLGTATLMTTLRKHPIDRR